MGVIDFPCLWADAYSIYSFHHECQSSRLITDCRHQEHLNDVLWMCDIIHNRLVATVELFSKSIAVQFIQGVITPDNGPRNDLESTQHFSTVIATR